MNVKHLKAGGFIATKTVDGVKKTCNASTALLAAQRLNQICDNMEWPHVNPGIGVAPLAPVGRPKKRATDQTSAAIDFTLVTLIFKKVIP